MRRRLLAGNSIAFMMAHHDTVWGKYEALCLRYLLGNMHFPKQQIHH